MIRRILLSLTLATMFFLNANSQDEKMYSVSSNVKMNQLPNAIRINWINGFNILKNTNHYEIGIISQIYTDNAESLADKLKLSGVHVGYGKVLPTTKKRLSLELLSNINLQYFKSAWNSNLYSDELQQYEKFEYKSGETLLDISVGYGLKVNVAKRLYVMQSFIGGGYYSVLSHERLSNDAPEISNSDLDFRSYGGVGLQWAVQLSFGYTFK